MKTKMSRLWIFLGLFVSVFNLLVIEHNKDLGVVISLFIVVFYFLSRICEALEKEQS